ncbi:AmmeMemoRadiSam system protein B [Marinobacterium maritimum]|uniref:MEMO1 family protein GCM10009104_06920 n=1 Tax=Marinobacterium maritimum TaxID=500162 RepID=A0ABN1I314_9GAMM
MTGMLRPAAVAGLFYPADEAALKQLVGGMLTEAPEPPELRRQVRALVVPHAGLVYSGPVAAVAYRLLRRSLSECDWQRVVLLGPNHRVPLVGMAVPDESDWKTPLGIMRLDRAFVARLCEQFAMAVRPEVHLPEHSLEVQLPFLQYIAPEMRLVPVLVGPTDSAVVAELIEYCWQDEQTLVLISSDLSHYHSWEEARQLDAVTSRMICHAEPHLGSEQACGCYALNGLLLAAQHQGLEINCLSQMTSGDTAGDKQQVVGYGAYVCY